MTENDLQAAVLELAGHLGYLRCHFRPARTGKGWRTAIEGDAGFPDVVLAGHGRVLFAELKSDRGDLSEAQTWWAAKLLEAGAECFCWRPQDWLSGEIERVLRPVAA